MIVTTVAAMLLFLVQMLVGLPSIVAKVTLLSTVPERRTLLGLGVVSAVLVVVVGFLLERHAVPTVAKAVSTAVVVLATGFGVVTLARDLTSLTSSAGSKLVMAAVVAAVVTAGLYFWRPFIAVSLIIAFGLIVSLSANPLIRGMSQTRASNVVDTARTLDEASGGVDGWVAETYPLSSLLTTAGVRNLSGVNLYPNVPAWEILDPDREYEFAWNRYSQAVWSFDTALAEPVVRLVQLDMVEVKVNPCDPVLDRFALRHLVTTRELSASCLHSPIEVVGPEGIRVYFYERDMVGRADPDGWTVR